MLSRAGVANYREEKPPYCLKCPLCKAISGSGLGIKSGQMRSLGPDSV